MLVHTQMKHDIICWMIAIGLHVLLLLVNFNLYRTDEAVKLIPIVEVEYVTPEEIIRARRVRVPGKPPQSLKERLKHFFTIKKVERPKKQEILAGKGPSKLEVDKIRGLSQKKTLIDKKASLSKKFDLSLKPNSKEKLLHKEESVLVASKEPKLKELKLEKLKDKEYKVAKKDLPFQVANREEIRGTDIDTVAINLGKETSKGILTQRPTLKDIKGKADFGEGFFRVVKQEAEGRISGTEVLANLLDMAKKEEERRLAEYGDGLGSGGILTGKGEYKGSVEGESLRSVSGSGRGEVGLAQGGRSGDEHIGAGVGAVGESSTGITSKEGSFQGTGSKEKEKERTFRKGVVFSRAYRKESGIAGTGIEESSSPSGAKKEVAKKKPWGRVIYEIVGPLSRRKVLRKVIPSYPEWAEKEGIEAGTSVHFVVLSNGKVKDNIYVVKTSGYPVLDKLVMEALKQWQFASLEGDIYGKEEWGVLTFYFSLEGGA